ncbi:alpha/beta fold hydrolase [Seongchinamella unica]|uniref:Alpha/beta fold hydrolase n=1 Tax=Seongchinamella unica TaxID=2547392 RepID=A0A4R5LMT8_9GAMM|nr:alpha/beta fold hydrolase [Seongchinamella unica]TDG11310.1 alpha/beta fold hydrolase [Seongchinamella unica]
MHQLIDVSSVVDLPGEMEVAVEEFIPETAPVALLFCFPGGGCNSKYFDLNVPTDPSYSFAQSMSKAGSIVVIVDHLGVGGSTQPPDGFDLTLDRLIAANRYIVETFRSRNTPGLPCVAVGHSMGALLAILQQDRYQSFDAMALLGFSNCGMRHYLCPYGLELANNLHRLKNASVELARQQFGVGYANINVGESAHRGSVTQAAYAALSLARGPLLTVPGAYSLVPGCLRDESERIQVPVLIIAGDRDICGSPVEIRGQFDSAASVEALELSDTGHMHFVYDSRQTLLSETKQWISRTFH